VAEPTPTTSPVTNPTGVSGVAVYDQGPDGAGEPSTRSSVSVYDTPASPKTSSGGTIFAWVIGIVVLIVLVYLLLQFIT
jgi:hypothetical protein